MELRKINGSNYLNVEGLREVHMRQSDDDDNWVEFVAVYANGEKWVISSAHFDYGEETLAQIVAALNENELNKGKNND